MTCPSENRVECQIQDQIDEVRDQASVNLRWMREHMHPYFFITMKSEADAVARLAREMGSLGAEQKLTLADREKLLILALPSRPGSLYDTLQTLREKDISYAQFSHSEGKVPGLDSELEVQRFEFDRKSRREIAEAADPQIPEEIKKGVFSALRRHYPCFDFAQREQLLAVIWLNNENYVRISPPRRVAQLLWLFQQGRKGEGVFFDVEEVEVCEDYREYRLLFAAGNPPQKDFLVQTMEVCKRLEVGVRRAYCLNVNTGVHPYFLGTFYVRMRRERRLEEGTELFDRLRRELCNTQILSSSSRTYQAFVTERVMAGEEASLVNAFISFCHTNLAHNQPDRYGYEDVMRAFHSHPDMVLKLLSLFKVRFDPAVEGRQNSYEAMLQETSSFIEAYNTGHKFLDDFRRSIFRCCLLFIRHSLKTNFYVLEKQALAFRLDPAYLEELGAEFCSDLPQDAPFRITFFFGRNGAGYHIGFSDIARGGWRTLIARDRDDFVTCANTIFRENFVLAHTQHLKNKDIYEGGSKMVAVLDVSGVEERETVVQRLYKLQYGFINAFLDIYVTEGGRAKDPRVVDYYGEDEPIELGPDENMHDAMVETIARQSVKRGYMLGAGLISSKKVGINHKEYGVTSTGVVKFAEITMAELGVDIHEEPFSVKFTGGTNGDVAGNAMRLLLERCPKVAIKLIVDGTGALFDPQGTDRDELRRILLHDDLEAFDPAKLHPGGFILYRNRRKTEGMRELYRKVVADESGTVEEWVTTDEFYRQYNNLLFTVSADLFIPAGGRPETIDAENWSKFFDEEGTPSARVIVEGANSFITPAARIELQKKGVVILRDASANKCGVISSSYEIIGNLLLSDEEFLSDKERYVSDVIEILDRRAEDEARLIFRRSRQPGCTELYTEISAAISAEINAHYARLFAFFQGHPELCREPHFWHAILCHMPRLIREDESYRGRIENLPEKYLYAILASEIASSLVYRGDREAEFAEMLKGHLIRNFSAGPAGGNGEETLSDAV